MVVVNDPINNVTKKHITTACTCCRKRKVKCDGNTPTCSNCKLYKQDCKYTHGEDKRKLSSKKTIQNLSDRVKLLEDVLRKNGIEVPPGSPEGSPQLDPSGNYNSGGDEDSSQSQSQAVQGSNAGQSMQLDENQMTSQVSSSDWLGSTDQFNSEYPDLSEFIQTSQPSWEPFSSFDQAATEGNSMSLFGGINEGQQAVISKEDEPTITNPYAFRDPIDYSSTAISNGDHNDRSSIFNGEMLPPASNFLPSGLSTRRQSSIDWHNDNSWSNDNLFQVAHVEPERRGQDDDIVDQLSARIGAFQIAEDGQLRYFGATSNLHILHNGVFSLSRSPTRSIRTEGKEVLERAGLSGPVNPEIERHLADMYFKWEDPAIHVVDEEMYREEHEKWNLGVDGSPFYSETLKNAICAVGACLTSRTDLGMPEPAAEFFSMRAKTLLEIEMDSPTIATVQALVVMSASEAAFTRDARGWLYSGMAVRLSADLGLHLDLSSHVQEGRLTARELDVRRTAFWGVFIHDNMWSLYVGRPWGINIRDISISRPQRERDSTKHKTWRPEPTMKNDIPSKQETAELHDPIEACSDSNVSLCEMMRRLSKALYAGRSLSDQELCDFATNMRQSFASWYDSLPADLAVDVNDESHIYLPHVLQLHMQFYAVSIFLHRPFFSRTISHATCTNNSAISTVTQTARQHCLTAARSLVSLLRLYRTQHTLRRTNVQIVHLVFTASLIHIYNTCTSTGQESLTALNDLQFCCQALTEIGTAWKNGVRALEVLICIKREWQGKAIWSHSSGGYLKRPLDSGIASAGGDGRKKRVVEGKGDEEVTDGMAGGRDRLEGYPLMGTYAENSLALGYLNSFPREIEFQEEGLDTLDSLR